MMGDPSRGGKLFISKSCIVCHSINGIGGKEARDLGQPASHLMTSYGVISSMWNHGPEMRKKIKELKIEYPNLDIQETADILSFLFNATYFNDQGSYDEGRKVIEEKRCLDCHSIKENESNSIISWGQYLHPIVWIQKMWNHAPSMLENMKSKNIEWPIFKENEMADLLTYLNAKSPVLKDVSGILPGSAKEGERIYKEKRCGECHGKKASDLMKSSEKTRTLITLASEMWNHYPEMSSMEEAKKISFPVFDKKEISDLVSYIFTTRYFYIKGNAEKGKMVFKEKKCSDCHLGKGGPPLDFFKNKCSPAFMISEMWNHGPLMEKKFQELNYQWPNLKEEEVIDMMQFLNEGIQ